MTRFLLVALCIVLSACVQEESPKTRGMFFWKTILTIDQQEAKLLKDLDINTLYVRYFDVSGFEVSTCSPNQPLRFARPIVLGMYEIVPCVYIENDIFARAADSSDIELLGHRITRYMLEIDSVVSMYTSSGRRSYPNRLLVDCDWSPSTSVSFFALLRSIKNALPNTNVESTIRLWQYRHPDMAGIPPVQRGLLMCYNIEQ